MKTPTLEEVKEYFKDAKEVESCYGELVKIDLNKISFDVRAYYIEMDNYFYSIWTENKGYAKIISYKEKPMKITNKFIKENADKTLKEVFPDVFKENFKFNIHYKNKRHSKSLIYPKSIDKEGNLYRYGFDKNGNFLNIKDNSGRIYLCNSIAKEYLIPATEQEVFEALKKEAKRIGYKVGDYVDKIHAISNEMIQGEYPDFVLGVNNVLWYGGVVIFNNGIYASITPTITKEEAEEQLGRKII